MNARKTNIRPMLSGSMIDILHPCLCDGAFVNRKTIKFNDQDWFRYVQHLKEDLGLELLILQSTTVNDTWRQDQPKSLYPSEYIKEQWPTESKDPVGALYKACSALGVKLYVGSGYPEFNTCYGPISNESFEWHKNVFTELHTRYGAEPSFAGFYMVSEATIRVNGIFVDEQTMFFRRRTDMLHRLAPDSSVIAVYGVGGYPIDPEYHAAHINATGLDAVLYSLDCIAWYSRHDAPYNAERWRIKYETIRKAHDMCKAEFWAHPESFIFENDLTMLNTIVPMDYNTFFKQLDLAAEYADRITCYTVPGMMTSQEKFPGLGVPETQDFYNAYCKRMKECE